jgi:uncharacterized metal-binding protein YceD (DUF177 family)
MKVDVRNIREEIKISISGSESWLERIYKYFPTNKDQERPLVSATFSIVHDASLSCFIVRGELAYAPYVDCSRCAIKIQWPIKESFEIYYMKKTKAVPSLEEDLQEEDFGEYLLVNDEIDLEEVLNDQIQLAIPTQTVRVSSGSKGDCMVCGKDVTSLLVYGNTTEDVAPNPFAVLKDLKTKN